jgi:hypothetical protein
MYCNTGDIIGIYIMDVSPHILIYFGGICGRFMVYINQLVNIDLTENWKISVWNL